MFPTAPIKQNALWYKLYKSVDSDAAVIEAHKMYLLYRDMAALSLLMMIIVPIDFLLGSANFGALSSTALIFGLQYIVTAISARHSGIRFVCNVLAIHAVRRVKTS